MRSYWRNHERELARAAAYRKAHREELNEKEKLRYARGGRQLALALAKEKRAHVRGASGSISAEQLFWLHKYWGQRCAYCGTPVSEGQGSNLDHAVPVSLGGQHELSNAVIACHTCNTIKRDKPLRDWLDFCQHEYGLCPQAFMEKLYAQPRAYHAWATASAAELNDLAAPLEEDHRRDACATSNGGPGRPPHHTESISPRGVA